MTPSLAMEVLYHLSYEGEPLSDHETGLIRFTIDEDGLTFGASGSTM